MSACSITPDYIALVDLYFQNRNYSDLAQNILQDQNEGYFYNIEEIANVLDKRSKERLEFMKGDETLPSFSKYAFITEFNNQFNSRKIKAANSFFAKPIIELYVNGEESLTYMYNNFERELVRLAFIDDSPTASFAEAVTIDNTSLNNKIHNFKNKLFNILFKYASENNKLGYQDIEYTDLYIDNKFTNAVVSIDGEQELLYDKVMRDISNIFSNWSTVVELHNEQKVAKLDIYNAAIMLSKFDEIIKNKFSDIISVNTYNFGALGESINAFHYFLEFKGTKSAYWMKDNFESHGVENYTSSFMKMIAGNIPLLDANGKAIKNQFLGMNRIYLISVFLKQMNLDESDFYNFQDNPKKNLKIFLDKLLEKENLEIKGSLVSLYNYLYGTGDVVNKIEEAKMFNPDLAPSLIDLEAIIAHQVNNTVGNKWGQYVVGDTQTDKVILSLAGKATKEGEVLDTVLRHMAVSFDEFENLKIDGDNITYKGAKVELRRLLETLTGLDLNTSAMSYLRQTAAVNKDANKEANLSKVLTNSIKAFKSAFTALVNEKDPKETLSKNSSVKTLLTAVISAMNPEALMSFKDSQGNLIPTVGQSNLMQEVKTALSLAKENFNDNSGLLFLENNNLIKGTETLQEVVTSTGESVKPFNLNPEENLLLNLSVNYLTKIASTKGEQEIVEILEDENGLVKKESKKEDLLDSDYISIKLVNFSDKISINNLLIDQTQELTYKDAKLTHTNATGQKVNSTLKNIPLNQLKDLSNNTLNTYYKKISNIIINNYMKLLDAEGKKVFKDFSVTKNGYLNRDIPKTIASINNTLKTMTESQLDELIRFNWVRTKDTSDPLVFVKEVSFSNYGGTLAFNKTIQGYIERTTEDSVNKISELAEKKFILKLKELSPDFGFIEKAFKDKETITNQFDYLNLDKSNLDEWFILNKSKAFNPTVGKMNWYRVPRTSGRGFDYYSIEDALPDLSKAELNPVVAKWLHTQNLVRFSYLGLTTKHEYQHPHKVKGATYDSINFETEITGRSISMTKRMVIGPATMELYMQGLDNGIPAKIKFAVVKDLKAISYNLSGERKSHDALDGSISSSPFLSYLLKNSLPNKGLSDVQKAIGHDAKAAYSTFVKCALYTYNNEIIRKSMGGSINLDRVMRQMHNIPIEDTLDISQNSLGDWINFDQIVPEGIYYKVGTTIYKVDRFQKLEGNIYTIYLTNQKTLDEITREVPINNLYDLWQIFGGAYSRSLLNGEYVYSDASIEAVGNIISLVKDFNGELVLKDKMIGILAQESAVKNGSANTNGVDIFTPEFDEQGNEILKDIMYTDFDTHFFGVQLDANHISDESMVNEVSQVVSALAQNQATPELYSELYKVISNIIDAEIVEYKKKYKVDVTKDGKTVSRYDLDKLSKEYVKILTRDEKSYGNSREIADLLLTRAQIHLPISNNNFFNGFVISVMSKLTSDFIKRSYPGMGAVINPSYGTMQLYEDAIGNTYFHDDLLAIATDEESLVDNLDVTRANQIVAQRVIDRKFANKILTPEEYWSIKPLDVIEIVQQVQDPITQELISQTAIYDLKDIEVYYKVKNLIKNSTDLVVTKINNKPRDLKPAEITFLQGNVPVNIFDTDPQRLMWAYKQGIKDPTSISEGDKAILLNLANYAIKTVSAEAVVLDIFNPVNHNLVWKYLQLWNQRAFQLLDKQLNFKPVDFTTDFSLMFEGDDLVNKLQEGQNYPNILYLDPITNYVHKEFEVVLPKRYRTEFNLGNTSFAQITAQGESFFRNQVKDTLTPKTQNVDLFLSSVKGESLYIEILPKEEIANLQKVIYPSITDDEGTFRVNIKGEKLFKVPENADFYLKNGVEVLVFTNEEGVMNSLTAFVKEIQNNYEFIFPFAVNSTDDKTKLALLKIAEDYSSVPKYKRLVGSLARKMATQQVTEEKPELVEYDFGQFKLEFRNIKNEVASKLAKSMFTSWQKSNIVTAARIPSQAMQSFMAMKAVGYTEDRGNNVYVSHWQLWLQGSDLDIDKAYIMMYGFKNGIYKGWSPYFDYSSLQNLTLSEKLPVPNKKVYQLAEEINESVLDLTDLHAKLTEANAKYLDLPSLVLLLNIVNADLRTDIFVPNDELGQQIFDAIKRHNSFKPTQDALKNFVVRNIIETGKSPKNQVSAQTPITFGDYENIKEEKESDYFLWIGDGISMDQQQQTNAIGKEVIGIAANGIKDYFSLVEYFSGYDFENAKPNDNAYFQRTFNIGYLKGGVPVNNNFVTVNRLAGLNLTKKATELLNTYISNELGIEHLFNPHTDPSLVLSSLLSAATDNAKELILKTINAGKEFASMHVYLIMLGFNEGAIANYMTAPENLTVLSGFKHNVFYSTKTKPSTDKVVNKETTPVEFKKIFNLSKELTFLAKILGINQGLKASAADIYFYFQNIQNEFITREVQLKKELDVNTLTKADIIKDKPYLDTYDTYIDPILTEATNLGITNGGFKVSLFFNDENYKKAAINYYNLIKGSINVMDVMSKLPHFGKMIEASKMVYDQLEETAEKFRFVDSIVPKILKDSGVTNYKIRYKVPGTDSISYSEQHINNGFNTFDDIVITEWLKTIASNYSINLQDVKSLTNKKVKYFNDTKFSELGNEDVIIDLNNPESCIDFKTMMENNIIPHLKKEASNEDTKNAFIKGLVTRGSTKQEGRTYLSTRVRPGIAENEKNLEILDRYQKDFDALTDIKIGEKSYNIQDLLFIYNLIINKDRPGSDRLTTYFKNYVGDINGEAKNYYQFVADVDSKKINIFTDENLARYKNAIIFGVLGERGKLIFSDEDNSVVLQYRNINETLVTAIQSGTRDLKYVKLVDTILNAIKNNNILIQFNCE